MASYVDKCRLDDEHNRALQFSRAFSGHFSVVMELGRNLNVYVQAHIESTSQIQTSFNKHANYAYEFLATYKGGHQV